MMEILNENECNGHLFRLEIEIEKNLVVLVVFWDHV